MNTSQCPYCQYTNHPPKGWREHECTNCKRKFLKGTSESPSVEVTWIESGRIISVSTAAANRAHFSIGLFCFHCGDVWARIAIPDTTWRVDYVPCLRHRDKPAFKWGPSERVRYNYLDYPSDNAGCIAVSYDGRMRIPNVPKQILARDFLVLISKYPAIYQT